MLTHYLLIASAASLAAGAPSRPLAPLAILPAGTLSHFCVVSGWDEYNNTLATYATLFGIVAPVPGIAGGPTSNGTYLGKPLVGTTKIAFMDLNNNTRMEFLAGEPTQPSWWRDVYLSKGFEIHHMGYVLPAGFQIWDVVTSFTAAGLGPAVQWGRWGAEEHPGSGCYVYMDSQKSLGVTTEILASENWCDSLP